MKKQEKLAEEYAVARLQDRLSGNEVSFSENKVFTEEDIEAAFNAGRESVVNNMPELVWTQVHYLGKETLNAYPLGASFKIEFSGMEFNVYCNYHFVARAPSISFAKQASDKHYKEMVKQALGL